MRPPAFTLLDICVRESAKFALPHLLQYCAREGLGVKLASMTGPTLRQVLSDTKARSGAGIHHSNTCLDRAMRRLSRLQTALKQTLHHELAFSDESLRLQ